MFLNYTDTYDVYEIIEDFGIGQAITPYETYMNPANGSYGTNGYDENWNMVYLRRNRLSHLLKDSVN